MTSTVFDQSTYQIRLDWGLAALRELAPAHIWVLVDAVPAHDSSLGDEIRSEVAAIAGESFVVTASFANRTAVAEWILARQHDNGGRTSVNLVAVGDVRADGGPRICLEDQLAAGAVIDALVTLGIDHTSPDAAVACAAYDGLRRATTHLVSASPTGRRMRDEGAGDALAAATRVDSDPRVTVVHPVVRA